MNDTKRLQYEDDNLTAYTGNWFKCTHTPKVNSQKLYFKVSWSCKKGYESKRSVNNHFVSTTSLLF